MYLKTVNSRYHSSGYNTHVIGPSFSYSRRRTEAAEWASSPGFPLPNAFLTTNARQCC